MKSILKPKLCRRNISLKIIVEMLAEMVKQMDVLISQQMLVSFGGNI